MISWLLIERYGRRKAELESRQRSLEVMHLNRSAEVGALSASFAHEVSQPLLAVELNAERVEQLLQADPPDVGKIKEIVTNVRQANSLAMDVIRNLRNLLKRKSHIQDCDLNAVIADAVQLLSPEANRRNCDLRIQGIQRALLVRADPVHLQQVVLNLVTNAMDATTELCSGRAYRLRSKQGSQQNQASKYRYVTPGQASLRTSSTRSSVRFTRPRNRAQDLDCRSLVRSSRRTTGGFGQTIKPAGGAVFRFTLPLVRPLSLNAGDRGNAGVRKRCPTKKQPSDRLQFHESGDRTDHLS